ncbi:MAG: fumarylacetoacetate hydrolase family protein [Planctomycetes bacterium]|nr:fumarylacetoacetate hydrolase family protein [Planctomycetota bacterium]
MILARFLTTEGRTCFGRLRDERTAELLTGDLYGELVFSSTTVPVAKLLPPVVPPNIFAIGRNYRAHVAETGARPPGQPLVFMKATTALTATETAIVLPESAPDEVDFEAELAVVIGRVARRVTEDEALDYVLGYTCANDVSARDCQRNDKQWTRAKGFDTFCPLGPWLVTADALDPDALAIRSRLNGHVMQDSHTREMTFSCRRLISYLSHQFTLRPGTVILTGTPDGVGFARRPPVFLQPGDRIEVELEGIGTLVNEVTC